MNQSIIDVAVNIATRAALNGTPVSQVVWIPPTTATQPAIGGFAVQYADPRSGSETPPWETGK